MATTGNGEILDERAQHLLRVLISRYIREGQPIGSRTLTRDSGLDLSPATIRNIMADLEDFGFLTAPHTSAGRIPTIKGYRLFVDTLIKLTPPRDDELNRFRKALEEAAGDPQTLASSVSGLLSLLTQLAGVVTVPRRAHTALRQIEFLPLSNHRVLAILVVNDREVQNRMLNVERDFTQDELRQAGNYLTDQFGGRDIHQVRVELVEQLEKTRESMNALMVEAIELAQRAFQEEDPPGGYVLSGETNLMGLEDLGDMDKLKSLFAAFSRQRDMLHLLDQSLNAEGVQIYIGHESGYQLLDSCSVIAAPYSTGDDTLGVLGVIGPTRMAYERVIPIVDFTAKLLGRVLSNA
ncbi:MAG TPA: heat-inducible transcriptional repressor HrcA [Gammaproteobacteria bacterium]|nr:heat-inducible transcriptional repressor HrcA [Gammaproteobacteria bacterium]